MANIRTHYDNLKIAKNAPDAVIRAAYKVLIQTYHPDKFDGTEQEALRIAKIITNSYTVLIDPVKRAAHDQWIDSQQRAEAQFSEVDEQPYYQQQNTQQANTPPSPPPSPAKPKPEKDSTPTYSWRRFFARYIDYFISSVLMILALVLCQALDFQLPDWINHVLYNPEMSAFQDTAIWAFLSALLWVAIEANCLSIFGTTPGKALFRLRLVSDNKEPDYWGRSIAVWSTGVGFNIPLVSFITIANADFQLKKNGRTNYDIKTGFSVKGEPLGIIRIILLTVLLAVMLLVSSLSDVINKNIKKQSLSTQETKQQVQSSSVPEENVTASPLASFQEPKQQIHIQEAKPYISADDYLAQSGIETTDKPAPSYNANFGLALSNIDFSVQSGDKLQIELGMTESAITPKIFKTDNPPRIALDFIGTKSALPKKMYPINTGSVSSIYVVEREDKLRVVINLFTQSYYDAKVVGNKVIVSLSPIKNSVIPSSKVHAENKATIYKIGERLPDGGIVFYVNASGKHGLAAQPVDEEPASYFAAKNIIYGQNWHLPTIDELNLLYQQKNVVGGFEPMNYLSSTVDDASSCVWDLSFYEGSHGQLSQKPFCNSYMHLAYHWRAVRSF